MEATVRDTLALVIAVIGYVVQPTSAQSTDRVELTVGAGYLAHLYGENPTSPAAPVGELGMVVWHGPWGIAARYWRTAERDLPYGWYLYPYFYRASSYLHYSTLTARYRLFLDNRVELSMGVGARLTGGPILHLEYREYHPYGIRWSERGLSTRSDGESIDETRRDAWGPGLALEMFVGRKITRRLGIKAGLTFLSGPHNIVMQPVVQAALSF